MINVTSIIDCVIVLTYINDCMVLPYTFCMSWTLGFFILDMKAFVQLLCVQ